MEHIIDYVKKYGDISFQEKPFTEVDALVLAQFSYLKFNRLVPRLTDRGESISLIEIAKCMDKKVIFADERYEKDNRALFGAMINGKRFQSMRLNYFTDIIDTEVETQFSALTCFPQDSLPVIVYRGTDENIVGWREDFNMAFKRPVTGQRLATLYMNQVGLRISDRFIVCGHSKGGNFAVYASMNAIDSIQKRVEKIYSFDGPGFRPEILSSEDYGKIESRVEKFIPHSSLVGMLLENHENYRVVESSTFGVLQHNPYTWLLEGDSYKKVDDVYKGKKIMNQSMNEWILRLNDEQLSIFINTLFYVLEGADKKTTSEVTLDWKKSMLGMLAAVKNIDEETKDMIKRIILQFFEVWAANKKENRRQMKQKINYNKG